MKGRPVGYACREAPDADFDSGWRFTAGDESDGYMDDDDNHGVYDANTITNYDPEIVALLDEPSGAAFVRDTQGRFVRLPDRATS